MALPRIDHKPHILLVEDNAADAWLFQDLLGKTGVEHSLTLIDDGEDAVTFLNKAAEQDRPSLPDLILLDLNLPRRSGMEILKETKTRGDLHTIPVLILTSSGSERDVKIAYESGANAYFRKPGGLVEAEQLIELIARCWLQFACLPRNNGTLVR